MTRTVSSRPPRRPRTFGGVVYLLVVAAVGLGLATVAAGAWRTGVTWMGAALLGAAAFRLLLPEERSGMLRVRRKFMDVLGLTVVGIALIVLASIVPPQPPL